ncbi:hypothetical protein LLH00_03075, partial [bacterium]|nr:hypothetical protein [bacterium]
VSPFVSSAFSRIAAAATVTKSRRVRRTMFVLLSVERIYRPGIPSLILGMGDPLCPPGPSFSPFDLAQQCPVRNLQ